MIVESPSKAKTIEKYLKDVEGDFRVLSSQGHVRDIEGVGRANSMGIDFEHGYKPNYVVDSTKEHLISTLRAEAEKADCVWLASDEDREGEAIAWHLKEVLELDPKRTHRITFPEITKPVVLEAIRNPRDIDYNLVNAQQARRVMDRIVGFELSPVLWKKITTGLSAGRVQSVAVRLIVEKEREIREFVSTVSYRVIADFLGKDQQGVDVTLRAELSHRFQTKEEAIAFLEQCKNAQFTVRDIQLRPGKKSPAPPFTTSLLQQEASRKLHFSPSKTMRVAQSLYEAGHITYMRTDSMNLSSLAIGTAKAEILREWGEEYHKARNYHTTSKGAQEAHEAIRPSYIDRHSAGSTADEKHLYELIWKRTIASQMADAQVETTRIEVEISGTEHYFIASGEVVRFPGFMKVYVQSTDDETDDDNVRQLPALTIGEPLTQDTITATETFSKPPYRFNEASLVKKLEELGIGRPSTYATIIDTIQQHKYAFNGRLTGTKRAYNVLTLHNGKLQDKQKQEVVGADSGKLMPTDLGFATNDFLVGQFPDILRYDFTADAERSFDEVAEGKADWVKVIDKFYKQFHPSIAKVPSGRWMGRELGTDPATGLPVLAKFTRQGPCIQIGSATDEERPRFASLTDGQSIYTITLEEALRLFEQALPYTLGQIGNEDVVIGAGKYGPYIRYQNQYVSIPKSIDPLHITMAEVETLLTKAKQQAEPIHVFGDIQVLNGRYGTYIKQGNTNYKLPRGTVAEQLTREACEAIIAEAIAAPAAPSPEAPKRYSRKK